MDMGRVGRKPAQALHVEARVITAPSTEMLRNFVKPNATMQKRKYGFRKRTTAWKKEG